MCCYATKAGLWQEIFNCFIVSKRPSCFTGFAVYFILAITVFIFREFDDDITGPNENTETSPKVFTHHVLIVVLINVKHIMRSISWTLHHIFLFKK